jgi:hypothetical protein
MQKLMEAYLEKKCDWDQREAKQGWNTCWDEYSLVSQSRDCSNSPFLQWCQLDILHWETFQKLSIVSQRFIILLSWLCTIDRMVVTISSMHSYVCHKQCFILHLKSAFWLDWSSCCCELFLGEFAQKRIWIKSNMTLLLHEVRHDEELSRVDMWYEWEGSISRCNEWSVNRWGLKRNWSSCGSHFSWRPSECELYPFGRLCHEFPGSVFALDLSTSASLVHVVLAPSRRPDRVVLVTSDQPRGIQVREGNFMIRILRQSSDSLRAKVQR